LQPPTKQALGELDFWISATACQIIFMHFTAIASGTNAPALKSQIYSAPPSPRAMLEYRN